VAAKTPMRADTIFRMLSMTKPVVALMAVMLIEEGVIALDDAVERWLPEMGNRNVLRALDAPLNDTVPAAGVITRRDDVGANPGTYGWTGGFGTAFIADPAERLIALCLTQRLMRAPDDMALARDFFTMAYAALN